MEHGAQSPLGRTPAAKVPLLQTLPSGWRALPAGAP